MARLVADVGDEICWGQLSDRHQYLEVVTNINALTKRSLTTSLTKCRMFQAQYVLTSKSNQYYMINRRQLPRFLPNIYGLQAMGFDRFLNVK